MNATKQHTIHKFMPASFTKAYFNLLRAQTANFPSDHGSNVIHWISISFSYWSQT